VDAAEDQLGRVTGDLQRRVRAMTVPRVIGPLPLNMARREIRRRLTMLRLELKLLP
jgi:hypothetical protein